MGWGRVGQHRKTGGKGGSGKSGLMKHKWTWTVKYDPDHFSKKGFTRPNSVQIKQWINVGQLDQIYQRLHGNRNTSSDNTFELNLTQLGYQKLLGSGPVINPYKVLVNSVSNLAKSKVEKAGGEIVGG